MSVCVPSNQADRSVRQETGAVPASGCHCEEDGEWRKSQSASQNWITRLTITMTVSPQMHRDPRFDDLSGEYKSEIFNKTYNFINDIKQREKKVIFQLDNRQKCCFVFFKFWFNLSGFLSVHRKSRSSWRRRRRTERRRRSCSSSSRGWWEFRPEKL